MAVSKVTAKSKEMMSRVGGFSAFGFGVSFKPTESDRAIGW
jgi:hypothetical protein